ncbi:acid-sensing ion channel 5 isoform X1 [Fukomys damarensis]|uniref:acid-sensing ion channel 5 isoform X1 n=1 Tax=Fukomys damarensis TaxID=885580 RepID=UPI0005401249|nr:acid-sensing ion channel 5 isoform X1 [Fukomys damarensis]XP_010626272.1 acid-sensing ion channel 5 isoform X1 [Fukomys damarensis]XP_010626274.1 acid-sensing ion channel 5 isoform X1 [Fukomys damarensis]XP_010626275.1 acid-sensing ion channel 5 isoform X1 [Fukomys damarensis]XP_010626276.1 acid-sensing ion channel 5 isoform X1 [Fukomys damarensis]XP_010626277.1 acid-sensing ion channel 5 isoform X1 [Fukomys damarensis]XP_019063541.1 acid-sensing ion channel 5 isoform X1 [Fukomys damarensi
MEPLEKPKAPAKKGIFEKIKLYLLKKPLPSPTDRRKFNHDFAISTSFHGVHNIVRKQSNVRKVIWLAVMLGSVSILAWQIYSRLVNYFTWPTTTSIEVQYVEKIEFPAVTFCNLNRFKTDAVARFGIIYFLWDLVSKVFHAQEISANSTDSQQAIDFLSTNQNFSITEFVKNHGFYLNSSTLLACEFFGMPCGPEDFKHIFTEYGNCFTFNHGETIQGKKKVSVSGRGLNLVFNVHQEEFTDSSALGFADAGIIFDIHSPKREPQFDGLGLSSPVGMHTRVTIRQLKTVHQEYPWGECNPHIRLWNFSSYSTFRCLKECKARHIEKQCGCLPFMLPGDGIECDLLKYYSCVSPVLDHIEFKELCTMGTHNSSCPVSCEETEYPATISYSTFPRHNALKLLSKKLNQSQEYIRENLLNIEINYSDLNYKITQQQKAVSVPELLADVGGQLGLFCGASMITVIEIIEYIFTNFYWICILFLLKIPEVTQWAPPSQNHSGNKIRIEEC